MAPRARAADAPEGDSEERVLVEAAQRDRRRFGDLYEQNFERVYGFVARRVANRETAQDLTADVFHLALANLSRFEWRGVPFVAWLLRIAANRIADHGQKTARERLLPASPGPEEIGLEEIHHRSRVYALVDGLPADQRRVLAMRFGQQKSIREIAAELGRSEGAVKQLQFRALENLRARVSENDG